MNAHGVEIGTSWIPFPPSVFAPVLLPVPLVELYVAQISPCKSSLLLWNYTQGYSKLLYFMSSKGHLRMNLTVYISPKKLNQHVQHFFFFLFMISPH